jgi:hypothetical protein
LRQSDDERSDEEGPLYDHYTTNGRRDMGISLETVNARSECRRPKQVKSRGINKGLERPDACSERLCAVGCIHLYLGMELRL